MGEKSEKCFNVNIFIFLINALFIFICFPFFSIYPINTDVQPVVFLVGILILTLLFYKNKIFLDNTDIFFIFIAVLSLIYFLNIDNEFILRKRVGLLLAFIIYYLAKRFHCYFRFKVFYWAVVINFICGILHLLSPKVFAATIGNFVRVIKILDFSGPRGISGLASEPGFFGAMCTFFLTMLLYFYKREHISNKKIYIIAGMSIVSIVLTKSGTGVVLLSVFAFMWGLGCLKLKNTAIYSLLGVGVIVLLFQLNNYIGGRGYEIMRTLFSSPMAITSDASVGMRLSNIYVAIWSLLNYPFGCGVGSFSSVASEAYGLSNVGALFNVRGTICTGNFSALAQYVVEMGVPFLIFITYIFYKGNKSWVSIMFRVFAFMFLLGSFSVLFPPTWVLLGIAHNFEEV